MHKPTALPHVLQVRVASKTATRGVSARGEAYFWNNAAADVIKPDGFETAAMVMESIASRPLAVVVGVAAGSTGRNDDAGNDDAGASHDRPVDNSDETRPEEGSGAVTAELLDQQ